MASGASVYRQIIDQILGGIASGAFSPMSRPVELCSTSAGRSPSSSKVGAALFAACLIAGGILSGLLVGLPETRWFFAGTIGGGVIVAAAIG